MEPKAPWEVLQHLVLEPALEAQVTLLLKQTFGTPTLPNVDHHFTVVSGGTLLGYAALVARQIDLGSYTGPFFLLGLVSVDPSLRHQGIGTAVVSQALRWARAAGSPGVLLNCGTSMTGFYEASGFRKIANRASYLRQGEVQTDEDPVMLYPFGFCEFNGPQDCVFLGENF